MTLNIDSGSSTGLRPAPALGPRWCPTTRAKDSIAPKPKSGSGADKQRKLVVFGWIRWGKVAKRHETIRKEPFREGGLLITYPLPGIRLWE